MILHVNLQKLHVCFQITWIMMHFYVKNLKFWYFALEYQDFSLLTNFCHYVRFHVKLQTHFFEVYFIGHVNDHSPFQSKQRTSHVRSCTSHQVSPTVLILSLFSVRHMERYTKLEQHVSVVKRFYFSNAFLSARHTHHS